MIFIIFPWVRPYHIQEKVIVLKRHILYSSDDSNAKETFMKFSHSFLMINDEKELGNIMVVVDRLFQLYY